jgi:hypothetical protein
MQINLEKLNKTMSAMLKEWNNLNVDTRIGWVYDAASKLIAKGYYTLPNDVTVTGKRYYIELADVEIR